VEKLDDPREVAKPYIAKQRGSKGGPVTTTAKKVKGMLRIALPKRKISPYFWGGKRREPAGTFYRVAFIKLKREGEGIRQPLFRKPITVPRSQKRDGNISEGNLRKRGSLKREEGWGLAPRFRK